jgi:hypothetical protein
MAFSLKKTIKTTIVGHPLAVCRVKIILSGDFWGFTRKARQTAMRLVYSHWFIME